MSVDSSRPRVAPGTRREIGTVNAGIAALLGLLAGTGSPRVFTTLARHRRLFRPWLWFASALMPRGALPRRDSELVILRVAHRCCCAYELDHHERLARRVGVSRAEVDRAGRLADRDWPPRQAALLAATDELHERCAVSDGTWESLTYWLSERELIELPMLVGHYEMLAMTLNMLRVQPDPRRAPVRSRR